MAVDDDPKLQSENLELRKALNDAYAALEGQKSLQSFASFTFEDALDQQVQRIEGAATLARPNELDRVQRVLRNVLSAVAAVRSRPDDAFVDPSSSRASNTAP